MKVLLISHTCQSRTEGQPKAHCLAKIPNVDLCVLTPDRWKHYGRDRFVDVPERSEFRFEAGRVRWPWVGPAQFYLHYYPKLAQLLREFRPDIIDLWEEPWGLVSAHACALRNRILPRCKIISETEQNIDKKLPFPFERFRRFTLRNADYAVARNNEAVSVLRAKGYQGSVAVVPNAVDAELFRPMPESRADARRELGLDGFVVGYVGRLVEEKGLLDLIHAMPHCPSDVNVVFIGAGPLKATLEQRIEALGLGSRVKIIGAQPLNELPRLMNGMDALVLPSQTTARWKEQFGRVIIEASACGLPVIGTQSGAIPDVIGEGGLVVPERDSPSLADAITRLRDNPELAREMGLRGRMQVERAYTWDRVAQRMYRIYTHTLESNPTDARESLDPYPVAAA